MFESPTRRPLITGKTSYSQITEDIIKPIEAKPTKWWYLGFTVSLAALGLWLVSVTYLLFTGVGVWGLNKTVDWGWDITNFVWWADRSRRHPDFGGTSLVPSKVENGR